MCYQAEKIANVHKIIKPENKEEKKRIENPQQFGSIFLKDWDKIIPLLAFFMFIKILGGL